MSSGSIRIAMVSTFLLCAWPPLIAQAQQISSAGEVAVENEFIQELSKDSYPPIDMKKCEADLRAFARKSLEGGNVLTDRALLKSRGCIDDYSTLVSRDAESRETSHKTKSSTSSVTALRMPSVRYIAIREFSNTSSALRRELSDMREDEGLILDLRGNPGGSVTDLVRTLSLFSPSEGAVLWTYETSSSIETFFMTSAGRVKPRKVIILLDRNSASATEIGAATMKRWHREKVLLVGERTYGKSVVQRTRLSSDGKKMITVTTGIILVGTPTDYISIQGVGLTPDVPIAGGRQTLGEDDPAYQYALRYLQVTSAVQAP